MNNADRLVKMLDSLATMEETALKPRKREFALIAIFLVLAGVYTGLFDSGYEAAKGAEERKQELRPATQYPEAAFGHLSPPIGYSASMQTCVGFQCEPPQYIYPNAK